MADSTCKNRNSNRARQAIRPQHGRVKENRTPEGSGRGDTAETKMRRGGRGGGEGEGGRGKIGEERRARYLWGHLACLQ